MSISACHGNTLCGQTVNADAQLCRLNPNPKVGADGHEV